MFPPAAAALRLSCSNAVERSGARGVWAWLCLARPVTAEAAPPGVAKTTHIHLKKAVRPPEPTYRGPTRPRSPVMVFVGIPPAVIGTLAAVAGFGYALRGEIGRAHV